MADIEMNIDVVRAILENPNSYPSFTNALAEWAFDQHHYRQENSEAYGNWREPGQAMHRVLLDLWRAVTPDSADRTFGDDPQVVFDAVAAHIDRAETRARVFRDHLRDQRTADREVAVEGLKKLMKCPPDCPCLCHEFGITAEHGNHPVCPTKLGLPLVDPQWEMLP